MVDVTKLVHGERYFLLMFCDYELKIPKIKTFIYVGNNLYSDRDKSKGDEWFFQDPESYLVHGIFMELPDRIEREVLIANSDIVAHIYDIRGLINALEKVEKGVLSKTGI